MCFHWNSSVNATGGGKKKHNIHSLVARTYCLELWLPQDMFVTMWEGAVKVQVRSVGDHTIRNA